MLGFISFHFRMGMKGLQVNEKNAPTCVAMTNFFSWTVAFNIHAYPLVYADCLFDLVLDTGDGLCSFCLRLAEYTVTDSHCDLFWMSTPPPL